MSPLGFCEWLANTPWSIAIHESRWAYSIIESVHVLSLCLFLGMAVMLDLRLLGVTMRRAAVSEVVRQLLPWTAAGFVLMVISGMLLFSAIPVRTFQNIFFRVKMVLLISAGLNVWVFSLDGVSQGGRMGFASCPTQKSQGGGRPVFGGMGWHCHCGANDCV